MPAANVAKGSVRVADDEGASVVMPLIDCLVGGTTDLIEINID